MPFTAEELAEMSRADAEIEASFRWTQEEIALSRELDKAALLEVKDAKSRHRAEAQRRYREANKEKVSEGKRELREFRRALDMTQAQFALLAGVSQPTICIWETIAAPKNWSEIIEKIRSRYHVETEYAL